MSVIVRFAYRKVGIVLSRQEEGTIEENTSEVIIDSIWKEERAAHIWLSLVFNGSAEEANERLDELQKLVEDWLRKREPKIKIID